MLRPWTEFDDENLATAFGEGQSFKEISLDLNRSEHIVEFRWADSVKKTLRGRVALMMWARTQAERSLERLERARRMDGNLMLIEDAGGPQR